MVSPEEEAELEAEWKRAQAIERRAEGKKAMARWGCVAVIVPTIFIAIALGLVMYGCWNWRLL